MVTSPASLLVAAMLVNPESIKRIKRSLRKRFPRLWEALVGCGWLLRLNTRLFEPILVRQARRLEASRSRPQRAENPKRILFFQTRSNPPHLAWAGTMASALRARGHEVMFLGCSRELSASCNNANYPEGLPRSRCRTCYHYTRRYLQVAGFETEWLGEFIDAADVGRATAMVQALTPDEYPGFEYGSLPLGRLVRHSVGHYLRVGTIGTDALSNEFYRKFLTNGILIADTSTKLLERYDPDVVMMLGGLFMPEHVMMRLAEQRGKRVVVYEIAMLAQDALMLQHNRPIDYDDPEGWARYKDQPLRAEEDRVLDTYLFERTAGRRSVVNYWREKEEDERFIRASLGIDSAKRTAVLFPNITWDSALFEKDVAFNGMFDWLDQTIDYFCTHPEYQLIIRAHPAESLLPGSLRESVVAYVAKRFPSLPRNIIVVPSDSPVSSYKLMDMSQCGLSYASTTAIELGIRGVPVLVAGEVHFRRKGFTVDIDDASSYAPQLDAVMRGAVPLDRDHSMEIARRYAYFTFFRTSMPFAKVHCGEGDHPVLTYDSVGDLLPGKDRSLDIICDGIVSGTPFLYE